MTEVRIHLFGPFSVSSPAGDDITPRGRNAKAIVAMLALAPNGRRSRAWLQDRLWSSKSNDAGRMSLRQELSSLRRHFGAHGFELISTSGDDIILHRDAVSLDVNDSDPPAHYELLEGLDVRDPEFDFWLSEERSYWYARLSEKNGRGAVTLAPPPAPPKPEPQPAARTQVAVRRLFPHLSLTRFAVIGDGAQVAQFAAGLHEELVTVLSAIAGTYRVLAPEADEAEDVSDFEVTGSVRDQDGIRVHARVVSKADGSVLWTGRFEAGSGAVYAAQESISRQIVESIQIKLSDGDWAYYWAGTETSTEAWEQFQRGRVHENTAGRRALELAIDAYRRSLRADPGFVQAKISLGFCLIDGLRLSWLRDPASARVEVGEIVRSLAETSHRNLHGRALSAFHLCLEGRFEEALEVMLDVVESAPQSPELLSYLGAIFGYCGKVDREIVAYRHALTLTRFPPIWIRTNLALALLYSGKDGAAEIIDEVLSADAGSMRGLVARIVILIRGGKIRDAEAVAARLRELDPDFLADEWRSVAFFRNPQHHEAIASALRFAGL